MTASSHGHFRIKGHDTAATAGMQTDRCCEDITTGIHWNTQNLTTATVIRGCQ